jgi:hypothetical protein
LSPGDNRGYRSGFGRNHDAGSPRGKSGGSSPGSIHAGVDEELQFGDVSIVPHILDFCVAGLMRYLTVPELRFL